jgi:hypothetical protein
MRVALAALCVWRESGRAAGSCGPGCLAWGMPSTLRRRAVAYAVRIMDVISSSVWGRGGGRMGACDYRMHRCAVRGCRPHSTRLHRRGAARPEVALVHGEGVGRQALEEPGVLAVGGGGRREGCRVFGWRAPQGQAGAAACGGGGAAAVHEGGRAQPNEGPAAASDPPAPCPAQEKPHLQELLHGDAGQGVRLQHAPQQLGARRADFQLRRQVILGLADSAKLRNGVLRCGIAGFEGLPRVADCRWRSVGGGRPGGWVTARAQRRETRGRRRRVSTCVTAPVIWPPPYPRCPARHPRIARPASRTAACRISRRQRAWGRPLSCAAPCGQTRGVWQGGHTGPGLATCQNHSPLRPAAAPARRARAAPPAPAPPPPHLWARVARPDVI